MDGLTEDQLTILHQYKEIMNESDDDIARATLESLEWNLQKAIEASEVTTGVETNNRIPVKMEYQEDDNFPAYESMDTTEIKTNVRVFPRLNPRITKFNDDDDEEITPGASSSSTANQKKNLTRKSPTVDELSLDNSLSRMDTKNGSSWKPSSSRDDSGSGSTCSLSNPAQASTSAEVVIVGPGVSSKAKEGRKEKKRCKMSGIGDDETITFESEEDEEIEDDMDSIVYLSDDDAKKEPSPNSTFTDRIPLIPTEFSSIVEAMQNFTSVYEARYGSTFAPFFQGSLTDAVSEAFEATGRGVMERRPLAIYLHNDASIATNIFAQTIMCSDQISSLLKCQFVLWGWDMSQKENRDKLFHWLNSAGMTDVCQNIKSIPIAKYPLLVVLVKDRSTIYPTTVIKGHDSIDQTLEKLMTGLDSYMRIKNKDVAEEQSRIEREQIRQEQVDEYEKSLAADRAKKEELAKLRQIQREEELQKQRTEEEKMIRQAELASSLPSEPAEGEKDTIAVRLRFPSGEQKDRRFRMNEPLSLLVTYVESVGYEMGEYRIWTSDVPKKDVSTFDDSKSFSELNWARREKVIIEEK